MAMGVYGAGNSGSAVNKFVAPALLLAGGWTGSGLWLGTRKLSLPEAHTDYIFSVIGEEFGLVGVVTSGTSAQVFAGAGYQSAGKTGTAQAVTIGQKDKYNAAKLAEYQRDHALYMAYAPADAPKIALAVVVENAGFGAASAAPIARRVFDYWLLGQYPSEEDMAATQKGQSGRPIGTPRLKKDVPLESHRLN